MKNLSILLFLLLSSAVPLSADEIYLIDNTIKSITVTNVTDDSIEYKTSENISEKISRGQAERIVYSYGKEIEFYDRIYMKDGSLLKGKIIKKSEEYIEYNPAGEIPYDKIEASGVLKILYEGGRVENYNQPAGTDLIYFKDGKIFKASGIIINQKDIEFMDENNIKQFYGRSLIEKIVYKDGKADYIDKADSAIETKKIPVTTPVDGKPLNTFIEFEWGWNGYAGAGARFDYLFFRNLSINGAAGVCLWGYGYRASGALRYYMDYPYGLAFSLGAAYNTGGSYEIEMETIDKTSSQTYNENVKIDCKPVTCINASLLYSIQVNGNDKIYFESGYSYALQKENYTYKSESGRELSDTSKNLMKIYSPGGFIISAGYAFAI